MTKHYAVYGLVVASDILLPELKETAPGQADATIMAGSIAPEPVASRTTFRFTVDGVARYEIGNGRTILVDVEPGADPAAVRLFLLGSAMAALLHQRGMVALHANAVVLDGAAFAFMGKSGSGKSTLAAWFARHGCAVLSDDVCVLRMNEERAFEALPGVPRIRLCGDSAEVHGIDTQRLPEVRFTDGWRKHVVTLESVDRPFRLRAIYLIAEAVEGIEPLAPADAFEALSRNSYRGELIGPVGDSQAHFDAMLSLSRTIPVFRTGRSAVLGDWRANQALLEHMDQARVIGDVPQSSG